MNGHRARLVLAFFAIYVLWGSTYLAIRVAVETVPPLFAAGIRLVIAGTILYAWARARGAAAPSREEGRNLAILGALMFLLTYSALFWAEKSVPSGIASVLVATVPLWTTLLETFVFKRQPQLGGEPIGVRTIVGCVLVLASTIALLRRREAAR